MTQQEIKEFLAVPRSAVFTTLDKKGWPHSTAMWFVPAGDGVLMWTYGKSQKAVNARRDPRASLLVEGGTAYDELRGVLLQSVVEVVEDYDRVRDIGIRLYQRYTEPRLGISVSEGPIAEIERQAHKRVGLKMPYTRVASWDHRRL